jgi:hypothetical protein
MSAKDLGISVDNAVMLQKVASQTLQAAGVELRY